MTENLRFRDRALKKNPFYSSAPVSLNQASFPYLNLTCPKYQKNPHQVGVRYQCRWGFVRTRVCFPHPPFAATLVPNMRPISPNSTCFSIPSSPSSHQETRDRSQSPTGIHKPRKKNPPQCLIQLQTQKLVRAKTLQKLCELMHIIHLTNKQLPI